MTLSDSIFYVIFWASLGGIVGYIIDLIVDFHRESKKFSERNLFKDDNNFTGDLS